MPRYNLPHREQLIRRALRHGPFWEDNMDDEDSCELYKVYEADEYNPIANLFYESMYPRFEITTIYRIQNPYKYGLYLEELNHTKQMFGEVRERNLFHGTLKRNVRGICENNFDLDLVSRHQYGYGVSFSPKASYACHYCDRYSKKTMILAKVMIGRRTLGHSQLRREDLHGCDTAVSKNGDVVVKYYPNDFYPAYKINFKMSN